MDSEPDRALDARPPAIAPTHLALARSLLYEATREVHTRLEDTLPLASPDVTLDAYRATLARFHATYAALERQIAPHAAGLAELGIVWDLRRKLPLLDRDLEALGLAALPPAAPAAPLTSVAQVLGCMYVLEGATLGGKRIARNVARVLHLGPENGAAFFHGEGDATAASWRAFCVALELGLGDPAMRSQAVVAALATFGAFAACAGGPEGDRVVRTGRA